MKKIILLLAILTSLAFSAINEYKTDIYFGNGILTEKKDVIINSGILRKAIKQKFGLDYYHNHIGKVDYAYNSTHLYGIHDLLESLLQKMSLANLIDKLKKFGDVLKKTAHDADLSLQVKKYKDSIKKGHRVLVVAHSQGNLFAYEAFRKLPDWMQNYWDAVGIASPGMFAIKDDAPSIGWDNDLVTDLALNPLRERIHCNVRRVMWGTVFVGDDAPPDEIYLYEKNVGRIYPDKKDTDKKHGVYQAIEGVLEKFDFNVHAFTFYMGEHIKGLISGKEYKDIFEDSYLVDTTARVYIMNAIDKQLKKLEKVDSQWKLKKQTQCSIADCKDKLTEVEHKYDSSLDILMKGKLVYPFKEDGKLYKVKDDYVKADYGGKKIVEPISEDVCYALKDEDNKTIGTIDSNFKEFSKSPKNGIIEVTLAWDDKDIDMDLKVNMLDGEHDIKDMPCQPLEHFFLKDDSNMKEGVYPVYVTYKDANISQEVREYPNIIVSIKIPGGTEIRNVSFNVIDSLAGGHIADIVVEKNEIKYVPTDNFRQHSTVIYNSYSSGYSSNVSGGSYSSYGGYGGGSYSGGNQYSGSWTLPTHQVYNDDDEFIYDILWHISKADLGALAGAEVSIYEASDFDVDSDTGGNPIWRSQTTYGSSVYTAGIIAWDRDIINTLDDDKVYVIKVDGGTDIDVNDDAIVDSIPTINLGSIHALVRGYELKNIGLKVNIISELAYQIAKDRLHLDANSVMTRADEASKCLLKKDFDLSGEIDHIDALLWSPYKDRDTVIRDYSSNFLPIIYKIHNAQPIYEEAYNLFAKPMIKGFNATIQEDSKVGDVVGKIKSYCVGESPIDNYTIIGDGANNFEIDSDGVMRVSTEANFVYENKRIYDLKVTGKNAFGTSQPVQVYVEIAPDGSPILGGSLSTFVIENMSAGTSIGAISIDDRGSAITDVKLIGEGAKNFEISLNGEITVAPNAMIDKSDRAYYLKAVATNAVGDSAPVSVIIKIYDDIPSLNGLRSKIYENTPTGTIIGKLSYYQGLSAINSFSLSGRGAENFEISSNGEISISKDANISTENSPYYLQATATNDSGTSNIAPVTIVVIKPPKPSDPPSEGIYLYNFSTSVYFNVANGTNLGGIRYRYNLNPPTSFRLEGEDSAPFSIDSAGNIKVTNSSLLEVGKTFTFKVTASNDYISSSEATVSITVVDDIPTIFNFSTTIIEGKYSSAIGKVGYSCGVTPITSFTLSGDGASDFRIDNLGYIYVAEGVTLEYNRKSSYNLTATGVNGVGKSSSATVKIYLIDDAPVLRDTTMSILENSAPTEMVGRVQIAGQGKSEITSFDLSGEGAELFDIDSKGYIRVAKGAILDYEQKPMYTLKATATNEYDTSATVLVTINIINLSDGEPVLLDSTITIKENCKSQEALGKVNIKDEGKNPIKSFSISGEDSDLFVIEKDGTLKVTKDNAIDYETKKVYHFTIKADNEYGTSNSVNLTIIVEDMPDTPPVVQSLSATIDENSPVDTVVGTLIINDNGTPVTSVTLSGDGSEKFSADNNGTITVASGVVLDYETKSSYTLQAVATNAFGDSEAKSVTISLNDVPDILPIVHSLNIEVDENVTINSIVGKLNIDVGDSSITDIIITGEGSEDFSVDNDGNIYSANSLDYKTKNIYNLFVVASNLAGDSNKAELNIDILKSSGNLPPNAKDDNLPKNINTVSFDEPEDVIVSNPAILDATFGDKITISFEMIADTDTRGMPISIGDAYDLYMTNGAFGFNTNNGDMYGIADASMLKDGKIHMITAIFVHKDRDSCRLFIDGVEQELTSKTPYQPLEKEESDTFNTINGSISIGRWLYDKTETFNGEIGNIQIFNRGLSPTEILALKDGKSITDGLVAHYRFEDKNNLGYNSTGGDNALVYGSIGFKRHFAPIIKTNKLLDTSKILVDTDIYNSNRQQAGNIVSGATSGVRVVALYEKESNINLLKDKPPLVTTSTHYYFNHNSLGYTGWNYLGGHDWFKNNDINTIKLRDGIIIFENGIKGIIDVVSNGIYGESAYIYYCAYDNIKNIKKEVNALKAESHTLTSIAKVSDEDGKIINSKLTANYGTSEMDDCGNISYISNIDYKGVDEILIEITDNEGLITIKKIFVIVN